MTYGTPDFSTNLGPANVPQGNPDDGVNYARYESQPVQPSVPQQVTARQPETYSGKTETYVLSVREEMPRGGFLYHDFLIEHSGFGHYRIANAGLDEPYYTSQHDVRNAILAQKYEGKVTFGTLDPTKGWVPE